MSGSHGQPEPPRDGRYSLEDTIYELPLVRSGYAHSEHVLSGLLLSPKSSDAWAIQAELSAAAPAPASQTGEPDCTVWTGKVDERLAALEAQVKALLMRLDDGK